MMELEQEITSYMKLHGLIQQGERILIGCSGGIDSIVLLHFLHELSKVQSFEIAAAHVNHMLRDEEANADEEFVREFCEERKIPFHSTRIPIPEILESESGNLQDICRRERYDFLNELLNTHHYDKLAVAHHADDQMESILMAFVKGAMDQGVLGMPAKRAFHNKLLIRPMLTTTRDAITQYLEAQQLIYREDASNEKDNYLRNRIRHHVTPLLKAENVKITKSFQRFSEKERMDEELLGQLTNDLLFECILEKKDNFISIDITSFQKRPLALQRRAILLLLKYLYKDTIIAQSYTLWNAILELTKTTNGNREISLPMEGIARQNYEVLELYRVKPEQLEKPHKTLILNEWFTIRPSCRVGVFEKIPPHTSLAKIYPLQQEQLPLMVRSKIAGDRLSLKGMEGTKKVSRLFIDEKIPKHEREQYPVLVDCMNTPLAVPGLRIGHQLDDARSIDGVVLIIDAEN